MMRVRSILAGLVSVGLSVSVSVATTSGVAEVVEAAPTEDGVADVADVADAGFVGAEVIGDVSTPSLAGTPMPSQTGGLGHEKCRGEGHDGADDGHEGDDCDVPVDPSDPVFPAAGKQNVKLVDGPVRVGDWPVWLEPVDPDDVGRTLQVVSFGVDAAELSGLMGVGLVIEPNGDLGSVDVVVTVDYSGFSEMAGGEFAERLAAAVVDDCVVDSKPADSLCLGDPAVVDGNNDLVDFVMSWEFTAVEVTGGAAGESRVLQSGGSTSATGLFNSASGSAGDFGATSLAASAEWTQGGASGQFSWSYGFGLPDVGVGGPSPSFGLGYSSQAVDGLNSNQNSQASPVGLGWSLSGEAFVERSYPSCTAIGGSIEDWCWNGFNASLVLNGVSTKLIPVNAGYTVWRPEYDNGWRIFRHVVGGGGRGDRLTDNDGEWWEVVTQDGTSYRFGVHPGSDPAAASTWAAPVLAFSGDPCSELSGDWCYQGWRWNLDTVTDPVGVSMQLRYATEENHYGARGSRYTPDPYTRAGQIAEVRWGIPEGSGWNQGTHRIEFGYQNRCAGLAADCPAPSESNKVRKQYPDVPLDVFCDATSTCREYSPTFFSARRLVTVETATRTLSGWQPVDRWVLSHALPDVGGITKLWLNELHRENLGSGGVLPSVTFGAAVLDNRHDFSERKGVSRIPMRRVNRIVDELGGVVDVVYGQPDGCDGMPDPSWGYNTQNCYPSYWKPNGAPAGFAEFNNYVVTDVTVGSLATNTTPIATHFEYVGGAAWRHDELAGVRFSQQSSSQWRGYGTVVTTTGGESRTETQYFRGMDGHRQRSGDYLSATLTSTSPIQPGQPLVRVTDHDWLFGQVFESRSMLSPSHEVSGVINVPSQVRGQIVTVDPGDRWSTSSIRYQESLVSTMWATTQVWGRVANGDGSNRLSHVSLTETGFESTFMLPISVYESGDTLDAGGEPNDRCMTTAYASLADGTIVDRASRAGLRQGGCSGSIVSETEYGWDTKGRLVEERTRADSSTMLTTRLGYGADPFGRLASMTDPNGNRSTLMYNAVDGVLSKVTAANPLSHSSIIERDIRGNVIQVSDPHSHVTTAVYDGLGRLVEHRSPTEPTGIPTASYVYGVRRNGPSTVTSTSLVTHSSTVKTVAFVDGLGRTFESQSPSPAGGRVVSATVWDARGLPVRAINSFHDGGAVGDGALGVGGIGTQQRETHLVFDPAGRGVVSKEVVNGAVVSTTTTSYNGLATTLSPPLSTDVVTVSDGFGRVVSTRQGAKRTLSVYDVRGLPLLSGPANSMLSHRYDMAGRLINQTNPNGGVTTLGYDDNGNVTRSVDGNSDVIETSFDVLNRPTERFANSTVAAEWTYDTLGDGLLVETVSHQPGGIYTMAVTGYDQRERGLGVEYRLPDGTSYIETTGSFNPAGQPETVQLGGFASMPTQTVEYTYTSLGLPDAMFVDGVAMVGDVGYDNLARITSRELGDGVSRRYEYSARGLLAALIADNNGVEVQHDLFDYNAEANIVAVDHRGSGHRECFELNRLAQLTRAYTVNTGAGCGGTTNLGVAPSGAGYDQTWVLNAYGDPIERTDTTSEGSESFGYGYGPGPNQVASFGDVGFAYDGNGARIATGPVDRTVSTFEVLDTPARVFDTRWDDQRVNVNGSVIIDVSAVIPTTETVTAVTINVVAFDSPGGPASLSVSPNNPGSTDPVVVNMHPGCATAQSTIVAVDDLGRFRLGAGIHATHASIDVIGFYTAVDPTVSPQGATSGRVLPVTPTVVHTATFGPGETRTVSVDTAVIPSDASAVLVTARVSNAPTNTWFAVTSTTQVGVPSSSMVHATPETEQSNHFAVLVDTNNNINIYSSHGGDITLTLDGYVTSESSVTGWDGLYTNLWAPITVTTSSTTSIDTTVGVIGDDIIGIAAHTNTTGPGTTTITPHGVSPVAVTQIPANNTVVAATTSGVIDQQVTVHVTDAATTTVTITGYYSGPTPPDPTPEPIEYEPASYEWDTQQNLAATTTTTGNETRYDYWPNGARVAQHLPDDTTIFYLGGLEATQTTTGTWTTIRRMYNHGGAAIASRTTDDTINEISWLLGNHQGSITTTITNGDASSRYYQPYGARRGPDPVTEPTTTGFLNQHEDTTTLTYLNNRYHDPTLGGFISVDPLVTTTGQAYIYGNANPTTYSDPSGLGFVDACYEQEPGVCFEHGGVGGGGSGGGSSGHGPIGELTPNFNLNSDVPVCNFPTLSGGPCYSGQDALDKGVLAPLMPRDTGPDGFYEVIQLSGGPRRVIGGDTYFYSWTDEFFDANRDWFPAGVVSYSETDIFLVNDAVIKVSTFDRGDGSLLLGRSGSTVMDVLVIVVTKTNGSYVNVGPSYDPTRGGNVLFMFQGEDFAGATLYPIGSTDDWAPASTPSLSTPVWLTFDPLGESMR